jgi:hypothetical protein
VVGCFGALGSLMRRVRRDELLKWFLRVRRFLFSSLISSGDNLETKSAYSCFRVALTDSARAFQV